MRQNNDRPPSGQPPTETSATQSANSHLVNDQGNYGNGQRAHPCASKQPQWSPHKLPHKPWLKAHD